MIARRYVTWFLAAAVLALNWLASIPTAVAAPQLPTATISTYSWRHDASVPAPSTSGRDPPATHARAITYDADCPWLSGVWACPNETTTTAYTAAGSLASVPRSTTATGRQVGVGDGDPYAVRGGGVAAKVETVAVNGETAATVYGRMMQQIYDYGPGFEREVTLDSGRRVDALNFDSREVVELKPNNPRQIRQGNQQLQGYIDELNLNRL